MESFYRHVLDVRECLQALFFLIPMNQRLLSKPRSVFGVDSGFDIRWLCEARLSGLILTFHLNLFIKLEIL